MTCKRCGYYKARERSSFCALRILELDNGLEPQLLDVLAEKYIFEIGEINVDM